MVLVDGRHVFGRVILVDVDRTVGPAPGAILVYVYADSLEHDIGELPGLNPAKLLIPPAWTNRRGWLDGYWQTIESTPLAADDVLSRHCFRRVGLIVDEAGRPTEPTKGQCGLWGVMAYEMIDDLISDALNVPRAPM